MFLFCFLLFPPESEVCQVTIHFKPIWNYFSPNLELFQSQKTISSTHSCCPIRCIDQISLFNCQSVATSSHPERFTSRPIYIICIMITLWSFCIQNILSELPKLLTLQGFAHEVCYHFICWTRPYYQISGQSTTQQLHQTSTSIIKRNMLGRMPSWTH